jgi:ATP-dependent DNA ligase
MRCHAVAFASPPGKFHRGLPSVACPTSALRCDLAARIKHDGVRVIARKEGKRVRLYSRPGNDLTYRFPLIVEALARLRARSCIIDGEAVACGPGGIRSHSLSPA